MLIPMHRFFTRDENKRTKDFTYTCRFCGEQYIVSRSDLAAIGAGHMYDCLAAHACATPIIKKEGENSHVQPRPQLIC